MSAVVLFAGDASAREQVVAEVGGGVHALLGYAVAPEYLGKRGEDDLHVAQEGDAPDVLEVVGDFRFPGDGVASVHLRKAAEALPHGVAAALFGRHEDHVAHELRPGPDYGHVAPQDVEEFRQLVEAGAAEEPAVGGEPLVVGEEVARAVALVGHGAELDEPEDALALAGAGLGEEGVAPHEYGAGGGEGREERAQDEEREEGAKEVQRAFEEAGVQVQQPRGQLKGLIWTKFSKIYA